MNKSVLGFSQRPNWAIFTLVQRLIPILAFALVVGACASAPTESAPGAAATTVAPGATAGPGTTTGSESSSAPTTAPADGAPAATTAPAAATTTDFDGVAAPDFRLALADGSEFVLSDETKPVYLIFWAEW